MNSDIRVNTFFFTHPKTKKLAVLLGRSEVASLIELWSQVAINRPSGKMAGWDSMDIALASGTEVDHEKFLQTLLKLSFIDEDADGVYSIHNWKKHQQWAAGAGRRSAEASKRVLFRWALKKLTKKQTPEFKEWYFNIYEYNAESNTDSILDEYATYTSRNTQGNTPLLTSPLLTSPKDNSTLSGTCQQNDVLPTDKQKNCPHFEIIELYNEILGKQYLPSVRKKLWNGVRKKNLSARWKEDADRQNLEWWKKYFARVCVCPWLIGENPSAWKADLGWLIKPSNMVKVLEGKYGDIVDVKNASEIMKEEKENSEEIARREEYRLERIRILKQHGQEARDRFDEKTENGRLYVSKTA